MLHQELQAAAIDDTLKILQDQLQRFLTDHRQHLFDGDLSHCHSACMEIGGRYCTREARIEAYVDGLIAGPVQVIR